MTKHRHNSLQNINREKETSDHGTSERIPTDQLWLRTSEQEREYSHSWMMANNMRFRNYQSIVRQLDERYRRLRQLERTPCKCIAVRLSHSLSDQSVRRGNQILRFHWDVLCTRLVFESKILKTIVSFVLLITIDDDNRSHWFLHPNESNNNREETIELVMTIDML